MVFMTDFQVTHMVFIIRRLHVIFYNTWAGKERNFGQKSGIQLVTDKRRLLSYTLYRIIAQLLKYSTIVT